MEYYYSDYLDPISKVWPVVHPEQKNIVHNAGKIKVKFQKKGNTKMPIVFFKDCGKIKNV